MAPAAESRWRCPLPLLLASWALRCGAVPPGAVAPAAGADSPAGLNASAERAARRRAAAAEARCLAEAEAEVARAPDKDQFHYTTSHRFKRDIAARFCPEAHRRLSVLELGVFHGHSTAVLAAVFGKVVSMDVELNYLKASARHSSARDNIVFLTFDSYADDWRSLSANHVDVAFIDADHRYEKVRADAHNVLEYLSPVDYVVFDDYGIEDGVRQAVSELVEVDALRDCEPMGLGKDGQPWMLKDWGWVNDSEGILCRRGKASQANAPAEVMEVAFLVYAFPSDALMRASGVWRFAAEGNVWTSTWGTGTWTRAAFQASAPKRDAFDVVLEGMPPGRWEVLFNRPRTAFVLSPEGNLTAAFFAIRADKVNHVFQIANEQFELF